MSLGEKSVIGYGVTFDWPNRRENIIERRFVMKKVLLTVNPGGTGTKEKIRVLVAIFVI